MTGADDREATPEQIEEGDAQRYLEHQDPDEQRERAGLEGDPGGTEPLPDEPRDSG